MNKISLHIHQPGMGLDVLERLRPPLVTVMDADRDLIARMRAKFPDMHINVRIAEGAGRNWHNTSPQERANHVLSVIRDCPKEKLTVEFFNEPLGHDASAAEKAGYDERLADFVAIMWEAADVHVSGLSLAEGNWTKDGPSLAEDFPRSLAVLNYVSTHEYWWPRLHAPGMQGYHWRWTYILAQLPSHIRLIVSECGLCQAAAVERGPDEGWLTGLDEVSVDSYADDLSQYNAYAVQEPRLLGCCVFDAWPLGGFGSFRVNDTELMGRIYAIDAPAAPPEEPEPPGPPPGPPPQEPPQEEPMTEPKVIDLEHQERDFAYAEEKYGVAYRRAEVEPGQEVYRLVELTEKTGYASLVTTALDENGKPVEGADVAFYWPDAPDPPDPPTTVYAHDWHRNFIHGPTNAEGNIGPGMGKGAYHGRGEGGPHAVWVRNPDIPSDICEKLGMLAGTFHDHLDQKFKLMTAGEEPPQPSEQGRFNLVEAEWQPGPDNFIEVLALEGDRDFSGVQAWLSVLNSDVVMGPFLPESATKVSVPCEYHPVEGETSRVFVLDLEMDGGGIVFTRQCPYNTGIKGAWKLQVKWGSGGVPPVVEPPAPDAELAGLYKAAVQACITVGAGFDVLTQVFKQLKERHE